MSAPHSIRNEHPFIWLRQSSRFLNQNFGDVLLALAINMVIALILNMLPKIGWLISQLVTTYLSYGIYCYFRELESGSKPSLKLLFFAFKDRAVLQKLTLLVIYGYALFLLTAGFLASVFAALLVFQGGFSLSLMPELSALKTFALDHWVEIPLIAVMGILPVLFFYGSVYFVIPLIALGRETLGQAIRDSFKANLINWLPLTVFGVSCLMMTTLFFGGVAGMVIFGGTIGKLFIGVVGMGLAMFSTLYLAPLLSVFGYAAYTGIFENRYLSLARPEPITPTLRSADPYTDTKTDEPSSDPES